MPRLEEASKVFAWRLQELLGRGVSYELAVQLAQTPEADLHQMLAALERGCPPERLGEIFL